MPRPARKASMRRTALSLLVCLASVSVGACRREEARASPTSAPATREVPALHSLTVTRLDGSETSLATFAGQVLLVVNTASECGYTPQYAGLQALHEKYASRGFSVLGFPSNDFGGQEPGSAAQIATFCQKTFGVTFPMFAKVAVTGSGRSPVYTLLAEAKGEPKWNFHKYLVDKRGHPVQAWPSSEEPTSPELARAIERELARP
ncbi:MAG TPA: glutathione peroxidase [Polyangiales bacterium]